MPQVLVAPIIKHGHAVVVGWCEDCECYTYPAEESCPGDGLGLEPCAYEKKLIYICGLENHCEEDGFLTLEQLIAHQAEYFEYLDEPVWDEGSESWIPRPLED